MAQWLRTCIAFPWDLSSILSTRVGWLSCLYTAPGDPTSLDSMCTHNNTDSRGHTKYKNKNKNKIDLNLSQKYFCFVLF